MKKENQRILTRIQALLRQYGITAEKGLMLCGLSGGADSTALVLALQAMGFSVKALHCNFHLRGEESDRDEHFVRHFCNRHGIGLEVKHFDTAAEARLTGESIELAARRLRYAWFAEVARHTAEAEGHQPHICVAHHADDNVETLLLNLIRGAGLHGLTGMRVVNECGIVRPLLETKRSEILHLLEDWGESYVNDSTNTDIHYRRNRIRHEVLPLLRQMNPSIDDTLQRTMQLLYKAETALRQANPEQAERYREWMSDGFTSTQIRQIEQGRNGAFATAGGYTRARHGKEMLCEPCPPAIDDMPLHIGSQCCAGRTIRVSRMPWPATVDFHQKNVGVMDAGAIVGELYIRSVRSGDRFRPFGMRGTRLVSDYLTDRHRSRIEKMAALVVCDEKGILWLVGETIDQRAAVTDHTKEVLAITCSSE